MLVTTGLLGCSPTGGNVVASGTPSAQAASASPAPNSPPAQEVALEDDGGTYRIPVLINGAIELKFTIDSGASDVSIPADIVARLVQSGSVTKADFIGRQTFELADGSTVPSAIFRIKSLKVGTLELQNVTASLANANSEPLLGQSFLSRLSSWSMDNQRHALVLNASADSTGLPGLEPGLVTPGPHGGDMPPPQVDPTASDDDIASQSDTAQSDANGTAQSDAN